MLQAETSARKKPNESVERRDAKLPHLDVKSELTQMLDRLGDEAKEDADLVSQLSPEELQNAIYLAVSTASDDRHMNQQHLGGDFMDESGKLRGRKLLSLDLEKLAGDYPFLRRLAFKLAPKGTPLAHEIDMHQRIQEAADADPESSVSVPRLIASIDKPEERLLGFVVERLPRGQENGSLQSLMSSARGEKVALRLSEEVAGRIVQMYDDLHALGFVHGDVNEGNIYLTNVQMKDYQLPKTAGKARPSMLRVIFSADVKLLDFEQAEDLASVPKGAVSKEQAVAQTMVESMTLDIEPDAGLEDVIEASDEHFALKKRPGRSS